MIRKLPYHEIDFEKYTACLEHSEQNKYSAYKNFLDVTASNLWDVLVYGDYEAVMPVPFVKKFGVKIVVNPKLTQQLGVFSSTDTVEINEMFLQFLQQNYKVWYYAFNDKNNFKTILKKRKNYVLESNSYEEVRQQYSPKRKRKLRLDKGVLEFSAIKEAIPFQEAKTFMTANMLGVNGQKQISDYVTVFESFWDKGQLDLHGFYFKENLISLIAVYQEVHSSVLLGTFNDKELVKLNGASCLIDFAIQKSIEEKTFDFEGGNLPNLEEYFKGFRAKMKTYSIIEKSKAQLLVSLLFK